ncbi:hypothetical protein ICW40_14375 [Actinotalea ferrariae]|uniref:hypothetical protein n=1 Tax=Actinotalea ferrariae TaxID=1386098 RepID=UPI001C8C500F|nr:hypothetical protein [Actinotalea ferrariae]MBX9245991.1 hypothetical protein [Actinotalea ferrariae]
MPVDELNDPVLYSWWVPVLGVLLVALAIGYVVWAVRYTRRRPEHDAPPPAPPQRRLGPYDDPYASVRPVYLAKVDAVEARFAAGELDARALHLELSAVVREFGSVRRGVDTRVLTLSDLRRVDGTRRLANLIETYYRPAFARSGALGASTEQAIAGARRVISQW